MAEAMTMRIAFALLALLPVRVASAQEAFERVRQPALPGFEQLVRQQTPTGSIEQWVPRGQTLLRWTRLVTVQRFAGLARRSTPEAYLTAIRRAARERCPGAQISAISRWVLSPYPTAQIRVACPLDPGTNRPERFFMRVMAGYSDLYLVQIALRTTRWRDAYAFAERHMAGVTLCGPASNEAACNAP